MVSFVRYALYSLLLFSFDLKSVTIFNRGRRLQRPSQNRTCRFPTSGSSVNLTSQAIGCTGCGQSSVAAMGSAPDTSGTPPNERLPLTATVQPFQGQPHRETVVAVQGPHVTADPVVLVMARQFGLQHRPPLFHRTTAPHRLEPPVQLPALLVELLPAGLTTDDELPVANTNRL